MRRPPRKKTASSPSADECIQAGADPRRRQEPPEHVEQCEDALQMRRSRAAQPPLPPSGKPIDFATAQKMFATAIMRTMTPGFHMQKKWIDRRSMKEVAAEFIKPNDRLSSYERLEIYNQQYWYRLVDCMYEDFPGLLAAIGQKKFDVLITEYLSGHPSSSYSLRNLGCGLTEFIEDHPNLVAPHARLAADMSRVEWAWIVAFDGEARAALRHDDIKGRDPEVLTLALQPYITLLELAYPLDDFLISLKKVEHLRTEAGTCNVHPATRRSRIALPKPERVLVAVHRLNNIVYYKRLDPAQYALLTGLESGRPLIAACALALATMPEEALSIKDLSANVFAWFDTWTELGWLCPSPG